MDAAKDQFSDKVQLFIATPPVAEAYEPQLRALVKDVDESRQASILLAGRCAEALGHMDAAVAAPAQSALLASLKGVDDRVRVPAVRALARVGDGSATEALLAILSDASQSDALRGQAAIAAASVANRGGSASQDVVDAIHGVLVGEGSPELHAQLADAAGLLPVDAATKLSLMQALRSRITIGGTGGGD
jgi:HEAT repeat protein